LFIGKPDWKINNDVHSYKSLDSFVGTFVDKNKLFTSAEGYDADWNRSVEFHSIAHP